MATTESIEYVPPPVNLGLGQDEVPFAAPKACYCWHKDAVRFQSHDWFKVEFEEGNSPFVETTLEGVKTDGLYRAQATVVADAEDGRDVHFKYALTLAGHTVDPEVVVTKDPTKKLE